MLDIDSDMKLEAEEGVETLEMLSELSWNSEGASNDI